MVTRYTSIYELPLRRASRGVTEQSGSRYDHWGVVGVVISAVSKDEDFEARPVLLNNCWGGQLLGFVVVLPIQPIPPFDQAARAKRS
jgi:hypothetical protein